MRCLISGITGMVGSRFYLRHQHHFTKIYQIGRSKSHVNAEWIEFDFSAKKQLELPEVDCFFHFAGQTSANSAREDILNDIDVNVVALVQILKSLRGNSNKPFVVIAGTATEYGYTNSFVPINESHCSNPVTFYDISKLAAEHYLLQFVREGWLNGCCLRLANVYGGNLKGQNSDRGVIDKVFQKALSGDTINVFGTGEFARDYIHVEDVVSAFYHAWVAREFVNGEYFNIGTGVGTEIREAFSLMVRLAKEVTGNEVNLVFSEPPHGSPFIENRSYISDVSKFTSLTCWKPTFSLEEGIRYSYEHLFK